MKFSSEELKALCLQSLPIIKSAGNFIKNELGKVHQQEIEIKSLNSLVSYVDRQAEEMLVKGLHNLLPEASFLTEEETIEQKTSALQWIIDPLDGTTNFLFQIPVFSVSVALQLNDQLLVGIVYEINQNECFYAWKGGGAFLNEQPIGVSNRKSLEESLIATGFPYYDYGVMSSYMEALMEFMKGTRGIRRLGSAAVDLAYVSCGRFDAFFETNLNLWDIAAGLLLVEEAGGKTSDFLGKQNHTSGKEILACSQEVYDACQKIVSKAFH